MIKCLESPKVEFFFAVAFIIAIALSFLNSPITLIPLHVVFRLFLLIYVFRIFLSFRQWKTSKGISLLNAYFNFLISYAAMAVGFTFLKLLGYAIITFSVIAGPHYFVLLIAGILVVFFDHDRLKMYWTYLRVNLLKAVVGIIICLVLFYAFDMPSTLKLLEGEGH